MQRVAAGDAVVPLTVEDGSTQRTVSLRADGVGASSITANLPAVLGLGVEPPHLTTVIETVAEGGAGAAAGLLQGDRIVTVDGRDVRDWEGFAQQVRASPGRRLQLGIERDGARLGLVVTPAAQSVQGERIGRVGLGPRPDPAWTAAHTEPHHLRFDAALADGVLRTWDTSIFSLRMLGGMLTGEVSPSNLSGPVAIADFAGQSARLGWLSFVSFLALMSISLGVLNLLPVPVLDGGHIMYYLVEAVTGRPVSQRLLEVGQRVGIAVLATLMLVAFYNDIQRLITG
jgi:regulator of sigma E protease